MADPKRATNWLKLSEKELTQARERQLKADPKKLEEPGFADIEKCWKLIQADYRANPVLVPPTITFDREMVVDNWFTVMHAVLNEANENTRFLPSHDRGIMKKEQCAQFISYLEKL
jgi:hypothetical protein